MNKFMRLTLLFPGCSVFSLEHRATPGLCSQRKCRLIPKARSLSGPTLNLKVMPNEDSLRG